MLLSRHAFFGKKVASIEEFDALCAVETGRGELAFHVFRLIFGSEIEAAAGPRVEILK